MYQSHNTSGDCKSGHFCSLAHICVSVLTVLCCLFVPKVFVCCHMWTLWQVVSSGKSLVAISRLLWLLCLPWCSSTLCFHPNVHHSHAHVYTSLVSWYKNQLPQTCHYRNTKLTHTATLKRIMQEGQWFGSARQNTSPGRLMAWVQCPNPWWRKKSISWMLSSDHNLLAIEAAERRKCLAVVRQEQIGNSRVITPGAPGPRNSVEVINLSRWHQT